MAKSIRNTTRLTKPALQLYAAFLVIYVALTYFLPPDQTALTKYHLTRTAYLLLVSSIVLPLAAIWYAAFYGYGHLQEYTKSISMHKEGAHVRKFSNGLKILAIGLPVTSILTSVLTHYARQHPNFQDASVIIGNYANVAIPLVAFSSIVTGTRGLVISGKRFITLRYVQAFAFAFIIISVMFCALVLYYGTPRQTYRLPIPILLTTIIIPYLYTWFIGILAAFDLYSYNLMVRGVIYKRSWLLLSSGIGSIVVSSILLQFLGSLTTRLDGLSIRGLLLLIYILLIIIALGYILVALGAKRLQHIEEV